MQPVIPERPVQEVNKVAIGLHGDQDGVSAHSPEDLVGKSTDPRSVLEHHSGTTPVDFGQQVIDEKTRAWDQTSEHLGVLQEVAPEEQELLGARGALF